MTKEQFEKYTNKIVYCRICGRNLPVSNFSYNTIRLDNTGKCRCCEWIKRHGGVPSIKGYTEYQIRATLDFLLFNKSVYVNDLAKELDIDLQQTIILIQKINIGNKRCIVKSRCAYCGKEIETQMCIYMKNKNLYCNLECYWKHKPEVEGHGKDNWQYNRIKTKCTYCGKEIEVIPYDYNHKNSYGDNHNFCSQECYWKYRRIYYVGDKSANAHTEYTPERLEKMRQIAIKNSRSSKRFDSKIQLTINSLLDKHSISYEREYVIKYYAIDNFLIDSKLMIEVMGDYWHTSPIKYNEDKYMINEMQQNGLKHDKQKHSYIKNHHNIEILYLWEYDIEYNLDLCEALILQYINCNGVLENYHSFNWNYENNILSLNQNIITPYQDMKVSEYRHLIKKKVG